MGGFSLVTCTPARKDVTKVSVCLSMYLLPLSLAHFTMSLLSLNFSTFPRPLLFLSPPTSPLSQVTAALVTRLSLRGASVEESPSHAPVPHQTGSAHRYRSLQ